MENEYMSFLLAVNPTPATIERCNLIIDLVRVTFREAYKHLSLLKGRSVQEYCLQDGAPRYIIKVFKSCDNELLRSECTENFDRKLLFKLLRYVCGLAPREDPVWQTEADTLEFSIYFANTEANTLKEAAAFSEQNLIQRLNRLQMRLGRILDKVEEIRGVNLDNIRNEVLKTPSKRVMGPGITKACSSDVSYIFKILTQHIVHRMFVMVFKQLNCLDGKSICDFLTTNCKTLRPMVSFSPEEKRLIREYNVPPENMPIHLLHKLLYRVCDLLNHNEWATCKDTMEYYLHHIKQEHDSVGILDGQTFEDRSHMLYKNLESILTKVAEKTSKPKYKILKEMPDEPNDMDEAFRSLHIQQTQSDQVSSSHTSQQSSCTHTTQQLSSSSLTTQQPSSTSLTTQHLNPSSQPTQDPDPSCLPQHTVSLQKNQQSSPSLLPSQKVPSVCVVTAEEINISYLFKVLCTGGLAARTMVLVYKTLSGDFSKVDQKTRKKYFTASELTQLQGDLTLLDITLLYKLTRFACDLAPPNDNAWITQGDTLEYYLATVKKMRNELVHTTTSLSAKELETKIKDLESLLENILLKTSIKANKDLQDKINVMKNEIQPLAYPPSNPPDIDSYRQKIKELREELENQILQDASRELHNQYKQPAFKSISPITWCYVNQHENMTIGNLFTDLELTNAIDDKTENTYSFELLLGLLQENEDVGSRIIIVQGVAGVGKTSLCKYLVHLWSLNPKQVSLKAVDLLIYIQCRYVTTQSISSYLKSNLPDTFKDIDKDDIIPLMQEPRVLFIVDGYDEARSEAKSLVEDILKSLPSSRMIVTSRQQWVPKLKSKVHETTSCCVVLSITGFKLEKRDQFARKLFSAMLGAGEQQKVRCDQFLAYMKQKEQFEAFTQLPLTLALMALLFIDDSTAAMEAKTITELYRKLTKFMLKRLSSQLNISDQDLCREWMLALGKIAWNNLQKNQHHLSDRDITKLKRKGNELGIDGVKAISSLLHCDTQTSLTDYTEVWTFTHNCQQEFLAAEFIVEDIIMNDKSLINILGFHGNEGEEKKLQRLMQVIEFIAGLLSLEEEITRARATEIIDLSLTQAPWSYDSARRIVHDMSSKDSELKDILKNKFVGQELASFLDGYDPLSVKWILENTSLNVPPRIRLRNAVTCVLRMRPLLDLLLQKSCLVDVIIAVDHAGGVSKAVDFIKDFTDSSVTFIMQTWNSNSLNELVKTWLWSRPLHLSFPVEVFPLLWWELVICLVLNGQSSIDVVYSGTNRRCGVLVEEAMQMFDDTTCKTDVTLRAGDIIISVDDENSLKKNE